MERRGFLARAGAGLLALVVGPRVPLGPVDTEASALLGETVYHPALSTAEINVIWRKVQGKLTDGFSYLCDEWDARPAGVYRTDLPAGWHHNAPWERVKASGLDPKRLP